MGTLLAKKQTLIWGGGGESGFPIRLLKNIRNYSKVRGEGRRKKNPHLFFVEGKEDAEAIVLQEGPSPLRKNGSGVQSEKKQTNQRSTVEI